MKRCKHCETVRSAMREIHQSFRRIHALEKFRRFKERKSAAVKLMQAVKR